jgi:hypothetical protein
MVFALLPIKVSEKGLKMGFEIHPACKAHIVRRFLQKLLRG